MGQLNKEQEEVWDRLKHGLPQCTDDEKFETIFKALSEQLRKEIDAEILNQLKSIGINTNK